MNLREEIAGIIKGEALDDIAERKKYSRDTSIFERMPSLIVYPKKADDVEKLVRFVNEKNSKGLPEQAGVRLTLTARAGGSDMSGGPLTDSILVVFTKYINKIGPIVEDSATVEPGAFYRDFEKETLARGEILPSYPASRGMCTIGGMIANNAGGELNLHYGKTDEYVESLDVVLSDGTQAQIKPLTLAELAQKESGNSFEASTYRQVHALLEEHHDDIQFARPNVTKNSAGFALWDVLDKEQGIFDLTKLIVGSQGTLALITKAQIRLVRTKAERAMLVIFISDLGALPEIVHRVLKFEPESFESYDNHTFSLAVHLLPQIIAQFGILKMIMLAFAFLPEMWAVFRGGVPKLVLMAEFAEDTDQEALDKAEEARHELDDLPVRTKIAKNEVHAEKYWAVRRGSFALLRKNLHGLYAAPFIDDIVVHPDDYPRFLPELNAILDQRHITYTIAGHAGDANFHIIPLIDMKDPKTKEMILELQPEVYKLVAKYKGSITGEHNDGIIRTPYLPIMYGEKMCELFAEVKKIFDPQNIFNPGKKVGGTVEDIKKYMISG